MKVFPQWRWAHFGNATETREKHDPNPRAGGIWAKSDSDNENFARWHDQYLRPVMMMMLLTLQRTVEMVLDSEVPKKTMEMGMKRWLTTDGFWGLEGKKGVKGRKEKRGQRGRFKI